ncbi:MAG: FliM/FliN family flagellar motor switch protein [Deltaproteobacteria bacterium]|nr:FliM/FliN family flagellar motor switch protein [Deltaproteobacteria bacterium]
MQESLATYLSYKPFQPNFGASMGAVVERYLKMPCGITANDLRPISRAELPAILPQVACLLVLGAAPGEHKILVELDMALAGFAIDRLLGGDGEGVQILRPFTEIEEGVLSFLILKLLQHLNTGWQTGRQLSLSLDRFANRLGDVQEIVDAETNFQLIGVRVVAGRMNGYARLFLPQSLINKSFSTLPPQAAPTAEELDYMRKVLPSLGDLEIQGRVEAATLDLKPDDIATLEVGDIIILENHQLTKSAAGLEGVVFIRLGAGENGGIQGRLVNDGEQAKIEILEFVIQEQPAEGSMATEGEGTSGDDGAPSGEAADNMAATNGLLRDVPAPVVVELGRIRLNAAQVTRLRTGQIIRLPRGPNDPVDLVVNGKLFARGELIEVDGELGVRLMQVVGAG